MAKVLLIGDSISLDYGTCLPAFLNKEIIVYDKPGKEEAYKDLDTPLGGNGGDSSMVLQYLRELQEQKKLNCDLFVFNCGLHDIKHSRETNQIQIPIDEYVKNLHSILDIMQAHRVPTVFINSTPSATERYSKIRSFYRLTEDIPVYNAAAEKVMAERGIPVIDLYAFTCALDLTGDDLFRDHTHFQPEVIKLHAAFVAGYINAFVANLP